jgi:tight adherence protein B
MQEPWLIYGLVFFAAVFSVEGVYWLVFRARGTQKAVNRRLALSRKLTTPAEVFDALRQGRGLGNFNNASLASLNDLVVQSGLNLTVGSLLFVVVGLGVGLSAAATPLFGPHWPALLVGFALAPCLVLMALRISRARRIGRFAEQLPNAIDIIVRGLRIGHPFATAIDLVAKEMPDPIGTEFGMIADEMSFGQDVGTALDNLFRRVGQEDLLFLIIAVTIQSQTGGNLAEILARLARLMRERVKMRLKIKALSAEGRMSAWFLSAMPFILFAVINVIAPSYFGEVWGSPALLPAVLYGLTSLLIGNIIIYRMVHFKV